MIDHIVDFIFELNQLKRQRNEGFFLAGVRTPGSVAEHVFRSAQIGMILAIMEKSDPYRVAVMCLIHKNGESRIEDHHKVAARYLDVRMAEKKAYYEQLHLLPLALEKMYKNLWNQYEHHTSTEGIIAKDADWLEHAFEAREFEEMGYVKLRGWIDNVEKALRTVSAKKILRAMKKKSFCDWWKTLKKMTYKELYK